VLARLRVGLPRAIQDKVATAAKSGELAKLAAEARADAIKAGVPDEDLDAAVLGVFTITLCVEIAELLEALLSEVNTAAAAPVTGHTPAHAAAAEPQPSR
jgi:hypothetical protein